MRCGATNFCGFSMIYWLVVWNINFIFPYIGLLIIPIDFIFFRGVQTTNQWKHVLGADSTISQQRRKPVGMTVVMCVFSHGETLGIQRLYRTYRNLWLVVSIFNVLQLSRNLDDLLNGLRIFFRWFNHVQACSSTKQTSCNSLEAGFATRTAKQMVSLLSSKGECPANRPLFYKQDCLVAHPSNRMWINHNYDL